MSNSNKEGVALQCPQCGSTDVTLLTENLYRCNACGANVTPPKDEKTVIVNNQFNVEVSANGKGKDVNFYAIKPEFDQTEFLRSTYVNLAQDARTPDDIMSSTFNPTTSSHDFFILAKGEANISYSATVGYDYKVQYQERNSSGQLVTKTKTETDWKPFSGTHRGEYVGASQNNDTPNYWYAKSFRSSLAGAEDKNIISADQIDFETEAPKNPTPQAISAVKHDIISSCESEAKRNLPGDRNKDFSANGTVELTKIESYSAPVYSVDYSYKDQTITNSAFAFGSYHRIGETVDVSQDLVNQVNKKTKPFNLASIAVSALTIIIMILATALQWSKVMFLAGLPAIGLWVYNFITTKKLLNNIVEVNQNNKKEALKKLLEENKLEGLSEEEIAGFKAEAKSLSKTKHKLRTASLVLFIIAMFFVLAMLCAS